MERVQGIGGFFFRAQDPDGLARWYEDVLGVGGVPGEYGGDAWIQQRGETAFFPMEADSEMIGPPAQTWALNFRVGDLDAMAAQVRESGAEVEIDPTEYPNGRFAWTSDPEGNRIQLWQPEDESDKET